MIKGVSNLFILIHKLFINRKNVGNISEDISLFKYDGLKPGPS